MRLPTILIIVAVAVLVSFAIYRLTGGAVVFFALPLLFALPFIGRRRR
ncbi:MAG TPA: hypothetical protein VGB60_00630 [Brevundimonas sp.]|jgi:hypothetical protein